MKKVKKKPSQAKKRELRAPDLNLHLPAVLIVSALAAFCVTALASHNSFLYIFNDDSTANALFTVGKSIFYGWVPYQDLFGQHGFILYVIYGLGSLITSSSMLGVFVLECLFQWMSMIAAWMIGKKYLSSMFSLAASILFISLFSASPFFGNGGMPSEFALPFLLWGMCILFSIQTEENFSGVKLFLAGVLAAITFFIQASFAAFWAAFVLVLILKEVFAREWGQCLINLIWFIMGAAVPSLIIVIYFIANSALVYLVDLYFKFNWNTMVPMDFISRLTFGFEQIKNALLQDPVAAVFMALSLVSLVYLKKIWSWIFVIAACVLTGFSIYFAGYTADWLFGVMMVFTLPGLLTIYRLIYLAVEKAGHGKGVVTVLVMIASLASSAYLLYDAGDWKTIIERKRDYAVLELASLIEEAEDQTLLNYGSGDQGLYTAANILPSTYYFQLQNLDSAVFDQDLNSQNMYLERAQTEFVLVTYPKGETPEILSDEAFLKNYTLFSSVEEDKDGTVYIYALYKRADVSEDESTDDSGAETENSSDDNTTESEEENS